MLTENSLDKTQVSKMFCDQVYYVGHRYKHHALRSGYERYGDYIGTFLKPPVSFRWTLGKWGWTLNQMITSITKHPWYSLGAFLTEAAVLLHMIRHRDCLYHLLYGDSDLWLLGLFSQVCQINGNRIIASFHQPSSHLRELGIIEKVTKNIHGVILVSESQRAYFEEFLPRERISVIPHGIDSDFFHPLEGANKAPICITVGSHLRDFETFKEAIQIVWDTNPEVRFIAVGTRHDKNSLEEIRDDRIQYLEGISDEALREAYQTSQIAAFPFKEATANNAILEAMACGLPIVATDVGGTREYVDETIGILCPPNDPKAFAAGILQLVADSSSRLKKSKACRKYALKHHYCLVATQMQTLYSKILS
jgi:glycosyltransferase involved in cell wall biosynthesis